MDRLIYTAMTGAAQTMNRQAAVAHNLANVATSGYRAEEHRLRAVRVQSEALPTRHFVVDASTHTNFESGPLQHTGRGLDVALKGPGWVALAMPDGTEAYTRAGSLMLDVNGVLQTRHGIPVQGDGGVITIPPDEKISIGDDGSVSTVPQSGAQNIANAIGRIKLVNPPTAQLVRGGDGLFRLPDGAAAPLDPNVKLASGYLEGSNVNAAEQMVSMISLARQFEMQVRLLSTAQSNDQSASQILSNR